MGNKKLIGQGIFLLVLLATGYFGYRALNDSGDKDAAKADVNVSVNATEAGKRILALLHDLEKIQIDNSIFSDPIFLSLVDHSVDILPEPQGRPNPFRPIGLDDLSLLENPNMEAKDGTEIKNEESSATGTDAAVVDVNAPNTTITDLRENTPDGQSTATTSSEENRETADAEEGSTSQGSGGMTSGDSASTFPPPAPPVPGAQ